MHLKQSQHTHSLLLPGHRHVEITATNWTLPIPSRLPNGPSTSMIGWTDLHYILRRTSVAMSSLCANLTGTQAKAAISFLSMDRPVDAAFDSSTTFGSLPRLLHPARARVWRDQIMQNGWWFRLRLHVLPSASAVVTGSPAKFHVSYHLMLLG